MRTAWNQFAIAKPFLSFAPIAFAPIRADVAPSLIKAADAHIIKQRRRGACAREASQHLRRTTGADGARHPAASLAPRWPNQRGRGDDYHPELVYAGVDYGPRYKFGPPNRHNPDGDALEVATVAHQVALAGPWFGDEMLGNLAQRDPRLLDLLLGILFRYDP